MNLVRMLMLEKMTQKMYNQIIWQKNNKLLGLLLIFPFKMGKFRDITVKKVKKVMEEKLKICLKQMKNIQEGLNSKRIYNVI